jgi:hypothetical protein
MPGLVRQAMNVMDANYDGRVRKEEFVRGVMSNQLLMDLLDPFKK